MRVDVSLRFSRVSAVSRERGSGCAASAHPAGFDKRSVWISVHVKRPPGINILVMRPLRQQEHIAIRMLIPYAQQTALFPV